MNKKIVVMLVAVISVVSVILVSILGQIPNFDMNVLVDEIKIEGYYSKTGEVLPCEENSVGDKFIIIDEIDPGETTVILKWTVGPENASNPDVTFNLSIEDPEMVTISAQGIITFYSKDVKYLTIMIIAQDGGLAYAKVQIIQKMDEVVPEEPEDTMPI